MIPFLNTKTQVVASAILIAQAAVYFGVSRTETVPSVAPFSGFPTTIGSWNKVEEEAIDPEALERLKPDDYVHRSYGRGNGENVSLFVGYFKSQRDGRAPHSPQNCLPGSGWKSISVNVRDLDVKGNPPRIRINEYVVERNRSQLLVLYWYQQNNRILTDEIVAQFYAIPDLLAHGRTDISLIRVMVPVSTDIDHARASGLDFASQAYEVVREWIR